MHGSKNVVKRKLEFGGTEGLYHIQ